MKKINLVISDTDTVYMESLAHYIRTSNFASKLEVKLFSKKVALEQFINTGNKINILLCTKEVLPEDPFADSTILLDEHQEGSEDYPVVFKYQPLGQLLNQVITTFYERNGKSIKRASNEKTKIISVFSATGGTGKSTVAANLAKEIASQEKRVFYLNLELINSTEHFFQDIDGSSGPILYFVKSTSDQLLSKIEELKKYDGNTGVDLLKLQPSAEEMNDFTVEEIDFFIKSLVKTDGYDYIVIDLDSTINSRVLGALHHSDHVVWLLNNDIQSFTKSSVLVQELPALLKDTEMEEKVHFVLNRYVGKVDPTLENIGLHIEAFLPYVPEWKTVTNGEVLMESPVYSKFITKMFETIETQEEEVYG